MRQREDRQRGAPQHGQHDRGARPRRQQSPAFEHDAGQQPAGGIGGQQHAVGHAGIAMAEIVGETRHLRTIGIADEERRSARQQRHRDDDGMPPMSRIVCTMSPKPRTARRGGGAPLRKRGP